MQSLKDLVNMLVAQNVKPATQFGKPKNKLYTSYRYGIKTIRTKPALVYYISLTFPSGLLLYKIGYTSTSLRTRIAYMELPAGTKVTILSTLKYPSSSAAFHAEGLLHTYHSRYRYTGPALLASGNTELYTVPLPL